MQHGEASLHWQQALRNLLVDEYQDSSETQYRMLEQALREQRIPYHLVGVEEELLPHRNSLARLEELFG